MERFDRFLRSGFMPQIYLNSKSKRVLPVTLSVLAVRLSSRVEKISSKVDRMESQGQQLGIEAALWDTANSLRGTVASSEYKNIVLGILFIKYLFDSKSQGGKLGFPKVDGIKWEDFVTASRSKKPPQALDKLVQDIEDQNPHLKNTFPRFSQFEGLKAETLQKLIETISPINLSTAKENGKDILSRTYEYFLTKFAAAEGRLGGEFYTPRSIVNLMVDLLQPFKGTLYDPACGTGGLFVQAKSSSESTGGNFSKIKVIGQESNPMTWRLAKLNLALHQIDFDLGNSWGDTFSEDKHSELKADFILTNPPFGKGTEWPREALALDPRWEYGLPPENPSNYAWLQHYVARLSENGVAVAVMPNGTLTSRGAEGQIRRALIEADLVECVISLPNQLFYSTPIPVCLWILNKNKKSGPKRRNRKAEVLLIDGRNLGHMTSKVHRDLSLADMKLIVDTYHSWQGRMGDEYELDGHLAAVVSIQDFATKEFSLNPSEYVSTDSEIDVKTGLKNSKSKLTVVASTTKDVNTIHQRVLNSFNSGKMELLESKANSKTWREIKLKDVAKIVGGGTPDTKKKSNFGEAIPWITPRDMASHVGREIYNGERFLSPEGLASSGAKLLPKGSVLISSRAPIGLVALAGQDMATNQGVRSLILNEDQDPRFWFYLMKSSYKQLDAAGNGTTFRELRGSTMQEMTFRIPDLKTQIEIADYLNDLQLAADMSHKLATEVDLFMKEAAPMLVRSLVVPAN